MRFPAPDNLAQSIADRAVQLARQDVRGRGWKSSGALRPVAQAGQVGIDSTVKHLYFQNKGISPFLMHWVTGRTVPLGCAKGDGPHFRVGKDVGMPGWVDIPHRGKVFRQAKWRHPGLKPKHFMEKAISRAIKESRDQTRQEMLNVLRGGRR
ncbi:hypothetical protein SEA_PUPPER_111 [Gordonia phage Pupper]|uniref:Uncharacterized protein n=1 Tax=Gordonia phage Pupper TaxID=2571249 RepID=A0A4Y6EKM7_9CAUD|nr:hypothetical protein KHQ83_gp166 [Gordonia phage Pupper]QDF18597.1 hypothetical protein SEA_PUPPER_111 [Gordonia phage Pupper]